MANYGAFDPSIWDMSQMQTVDIPGVGTVTMPAFNLSSLYAGAAEPRAAAGGGQADPMPLPMADPTTGVGMDALGNPMPGWQLPPQAPAKGEGPSVLPTSVGPTAEPVTGPPASPAAAKTAPPIPGTMGRALAGRKEKEWDFTPATRFEADEAKGFGTPYYAAMTNHGDLGAAIWAGEGQRVRLVDPKTKQVIAEGTGEQGSQEIATLANAISKKMGKKASWEVQVESEPGQFRMVGKEGVDRSNNLLKKVVNIAAPILGAMIPGMAPMLGAALGGFGGSLATGGNLKQSLLAAATAGVGNSLGGALSNVLRGTPVSFAGANSLGGIGGRLSDALKTGGLAQFGVNVTPSVLEQMGVGSVADAIAGGVLTPLVTTAGSGGLTSGVGGALGSAVGGVTGSALSGGAGGAQAPGTAPSQPGTTTVEEVVVTPRATDPVLNAGGLAGVGQSLVPGGLGGQTPEEIKGWENQAKDAAGQIGGQLAGTMGVYGLAQLLGLFPGANDRVGGGGGGTAPGNVGDGTSPTQPIPGTPGGGVPTGGGQGGGGGLSGGGALGSVLNNGGSGAAGLPLAAAPSLETQGSLAPDIYPWRKRAGMMA